MYHNEQGGFRRFPRIVLIPKPKLTIMNRAASEDSQELFWWQVAKNANICLKTLADPTMNTTSFISSTTLLRNSVKSSPSSSKPIKKRISNINLLFLDWKKASNQVFPCDIFVPPYATHYAIFGVCNFISSIVNEDCMPQRLRKKNKTENAQPLVLWNEWKII